MILSSLQLAIVMRINQVALEEKFNSSTLRQIAFYESSYRPEVVGKAGEVGLFQIKQKTWDWLKDCKGKDIWSVEDQTRFTICALRKGYSKHWATYKLIR